MKCSQDGCERDATHRYTWPGRAEAGICSDTAHLGALRSVATALGLELELIPCTGALAGFQGDATATVRLALDVAFAQLDGKRAECIAAIAALAKELHNAGRLHREGLRRATLEALSKCCSLEYELSLETEVTSGLARDLGLEDELAAFEESLPEQ